MFEKFWDFLKKIAADNILEKNLILLKKQQTTVSVKVEKDGALSMASVEDFNKIFEVEYLPNLFFENPKLLRKTARRIKRGIKIGSLSEREIWLGTYFQNEVQNGYSARVYIKWIDEFKEYGLFADQNLKEGAYICEYTGTVRKYKRRLDKKNSYCFEYKIGDERKSHLTIDAKEMGNYARFINHSETPNLEPFAALVNGIIHIILRAKQPISKGTELTYNYGPKYWQKREKPR
jgi:uncharacterized protein